MSIKDKVNEVLDKTTIDDKIVDGAKKVKESVENVLDKTEIDDKIVEGAKKAAGAGKKAVDSLLDKTEIDDRIKEKIGDIKEKKNKDNE